MQAKEMCQALVSLIFIVTSSKEQSKTYDFCPLPTTKTIPHMILLL